MSKPSRQIDKPSRQIEQHAVEPVPAEHRHGRARDLFFVWFGANMQITAAITGAIAVLLGLPLWYAILAVVIGNLFGSVFMALHSAQGPHLGIPQMIQSRAQFGNYGAILPLILVLFMYVGFFAANVLLTGSALSSLTHMPRTLASIIAAAVCVLLAIYGYRAIHAVERWASLISGVAFVWLTIRILTKPGLSQAFHGGHFSLGTFALAVAIPATWQITYAPYVADYSRYLPEHTTVRAAFWSTYLGTAIGTTWMMIFGCLAAAVASDAFNNGSVQYVADLGGAGTQWLIYLVLIIGIVAACVLNLYGMFMSIVTTTSAFGGRSSISQYTRIAVIVVAAAAGTVIALAATSNFITDLQNFILFLSYFLIPWTAINLADFYLIRKGVYDIDAIFDPNGIYGRFQYRSLAAYLIGVAVEVPFMNTTFYTGVIARHLGGADISWLIGLVVSFACYYAFNAARARAAGGAARSAPGWRRSRRPKIGSTQ
jgi:NCS1 family nucleobase:cation symporter-1